MDAVLARSEASPVAAAAARGAPSLAQRLVLRPPQGLEHRACRMLLPELSRPGTPWQEPLIAVTEGSESYRVLGAASSAWLRQADGHMRVRLAVQVVPAWRRHGVATRMLAHAAETARAGGARSLVAFVDTAAQTDACGFLAARGFRLWDSETRFEASLSVLVQRLERLHRWLVARGSVPAGVSFVPLPQAPLDALAHLYAAQIGGNAVDARARLGALARGPLAHAQSVLVCGNDLVGLQLAGIDGEHCRVDAKIVTPAYRAAATGLGWADVVLMLDRARWALDQGARLCSFSCLSSNLATNKLARHAGAQAVKTAQVHQLPLVTPAAASA